MGRGRDGWGGDRTGRGLGLGDGGNAGGSERR